MKEGGHVFVKMKCAGGLYLCKKAMQKASYTKLVCSCGFALLHLGKAQAAKFSLRTKCVQPNLWQKSTLGMQFAI